MFWLNRVGGLVEGTSTEVAIDPVGGPRPSRTVNVCRQGSGVTIDGTRVVIAWDEPMPGVGRPWFVCSSCGRRCRHVYLRATIACRRCLGLDYAVRHLNRQVPALGRVERLRRKLGGCEVRPFAPLPPRQRGRRRAFRDRLVAMIHDAETELLGHLQGVTGDLERRIRVRKRRGQW